MNIGIITQARMTSSRLPGKILKEVKGKSLLTYHIERLKHSGFPVIVATTTNETDNPVIDFCINKGIPYSRGSEENVLSRFYNAAVENNLDIIVRVTSDCPLIDPHLIRNSMEKYLKFNNENLYVSNVIDRTFARGFDFEIFSFRLLEDAYKNATESADLEHVTPYIRKNIKGDTEFYDIKQSKNHNDLRITVDTAEDFQLIQELIVTFDADLLPYNGIEEILLQHPELIAINAHIEQKKV
ncbi:cytidylyltransferase domain-containing protein [Pseudopedobacter beijingensis]|uniref:Cytidylyltransferase domain-containing protein n=1 Tax=Pseudopedobacter beijingensis TaxID=1207056 RepID=A0ABW4IAR1_9SPHI